MGVIDSSLPLADADLDWSASDAIAAVKELATNKDGSLNFGVYKKAFFYVVDGGGDKQGDYKLPFATVVNGEIEAVWNGVAAAMGALNGAQGGVDMPDADKEDVYKEIGTYYKRFDKDQPALAKAIEGEIVKREIGEKVRIKMFVEPDSVKDLGNGQFSCTVTTSDVDRTGESIDTQGITTDEYMLNPVVLYAHDYSSLPIGKTTKLSQFKNKMLANFQLAIAEYPFAATVAALMKGGYLNAVSIGGMVTKWSDDYMTILGMNMLEFSVVPVPANQNALISASSVKSIEAMTGKSMEVIQKELADALNHAYAERIAEKTLDTDELDRHIKSLKDLTAILEQAKDAKTSAKDISDNDEVTILTIRKTAGKVAETGQQIIRLVKAKKEN